MEDKFIWKAEMAFKGAPEEVARLKESLKQFPVRMRGVPEKKSKEKPVWKSEIIFEGTAKEFNRMAEILGKFPVEIYIREWIDLPSHLAGCYFIGPEEILGEERFAEFAEHLPRAHLTYVRDIRGGIRTPHLHVDGDVVFVDREKFKVFVKEIAQNLAEKRAEKVEDYIELMEALRPLYWVDAARCPMSY
jgi:hypothetical protein